MGKGGGNSTSTTVQNIPPEVLEQYKKVMGYANQVATLPYQQYSGPLISGFSDAQKQAFNNVNSLQGTGQGYFNAAAGYTAQGASPVTSQAIQNYSNPYQQMVTQATLANMQENNAQQANSLTGNAISANAFGGDRAGVAQAELARQQALANNQTLAELNQGNYNQALGAAQTDQSNALKAGQTLGGLGATASQTGLNEAQAQLGVGNQQQQQNQNQLNAQYEQWQNQQQFPYDTATWLSQLSTGIGSNMGGSSSTTQDSGGKSGGGAVRSFARGGGALENALPAAAEYRPRSASVAPPRGMQNGDSAADTAKTLASLASIAATVASFLNTGGRVGRAGGGSAFTPTISEKIMGAALPDSAGVYLPKPRSPMTGLKVQGLAGGRGLPTAPAAPIQQRKPVDLGNMVTLLAAAERGGMFEGDGKGDKWEGVSGVGGASNYSREGGLQNISASAGSPGATEDYRSLARIGETAGSQAELVQDADWIQQIWDSVGGSFAKGGGVTPLQAGLGFRSGGR